MAEFRRRLPGGQHLWQGYLPGRQSVGEAVRGYPYKTFQQLLDEGKIPKQVPRETPETPETPEFQGTNLFRDLKKSARSLFDFVPEELGTNILDFLISPTQPQEFTTYSTDVLDKVGERLGRDAYGLHQFSFDVGGFESDYGTNIQNPFSSARGTYQFTKATIPTAINRLTKVLGYKPQEIKDFQQAENTDIAKLSPDLQRALFLAHLSEDRGSDVLINRYLDGDDVGEELFIKHHYKGNPTPGTQKRLREKKWF